MKRATHETSAGFGTKLIAGLAGAVAVNLVHEATRKAAGGDPSPSRVPRLDRMGQSGLVKTARAVGLEPPAPGPKRYWTALAGDIAVNGLLYAITSRRSRPLRGGAFSGVLAGVAGLVLPRLVGLGRHTGRNSRTKAMTFADYAIGGLVSGAVMKMLSRK
ncbi:MAG TPA: hypothetical protein VGN72_23680 [Tepidisphaeraceae bacterium]|jgi:hypothetical protein|nr:hypothetical protein [Tepidisphaeraceae bacterium]